MNPRLVRLALMAYPSRWRRRYGIELEEFTIAVLGGRCTVAGRALTLSDLVGHGLLERIRATETSRSRAVMTSISALLASAVLMTGGLASDIGVNPNVVLSPALQLGAGVSVAPPGQSATRSAAIVVEAPANDGRIVITGAPAAVVVDPKAAEVLSVTRAAGAISRH